jgi:hypothetical protein
VADTSPGGALLFFPSYATGASTHACTVAGDKTWILGCVTTSYCMF